MTVSDGVLSGESEVSWHHTVHVQKGQLPGQQQDREFLFEAEEGTFLRT